MEFGHQIGHQAFSTYVELIDGVSDNERPAREHTCGRGGECTQTLVLR